MIKIIMLSLLVLISEPTFSWDTGYYQAKVIRVVDGDTMDMEINLGLGIWIHDRVRVLNYDAPETWRPKNESEKLRGEAATVDAERLLLNKTVTINAASGRGSFGRILVRIQLPDGRNYSSTMINLGHTKE